MQLVKLADMSAFNYVFDSVDMNMLIGIVTRGS